MFNEGTLEQMGIGALAKIGWNYVPAEELPRRHTDVMVEPMVKSALVRLNPEIAEDPDRADEIIYRLRALIQSTSAHNLVSTNERFKKLVFEENSFPYGENGRMVPIRFFGTAIDGDLDKNEYVVTNQYVYPQEQGGKRLDMVLLVNGFPLVVGEFKTPVRDSITWLDGAGDIADYEKSIPQMFACNVLSFASEGKCYRYGSVNMPIEMWGPWHEGENRSEGTFIDVQRSITSMLSPANVMDIFQFFTLFSTDKKHRRIKIICRYQQFEGANLIVSRVRAGYPKKGLIWHFQGSGKSLLMVFAAQKLRMLPELKNPTVVIVDDRIDLETQITGTFNASDIPNMASAGSKEELESFFRGDMRKILITTIFKFGEVTEALNERSNIILMVDEAHRTQEGDLGEKMRIALPNAFFFGLTGTPINRTDKNTFHTFSAPEDKSGYMSRYSFADSIRDHATLPLHFETVPVELHVNQEIVDSAFAEMTKELSKEDKAELTRRVKIEAVMKAPDRIRNVCEHIAHHFKTKVEPDGFKAQVVCYDRECCLLYKKELDQLLGVDASTIVMDTNNDKEDRYKAYRRDRDAEEKLLDRFRNPDDPLKILIVTAKLLTGFDAPILQTQYLDKPLRDHTLLQAICRTNRVYNGKKSFGLIVDYIGLFDNVAKSLHFDEKEVQTVITNIEEVKKELPRLIHTCLSYFPGITSRDTDWETLLRAQQCLPSTKVKDAFGADFSVLNRVWEALSPDPCLAPYKRDFIWLSQIYESVRPVDNRGKLIWASLGPKTIELVHQNITVEGVHDDGDILELSEEIIEHFINDGKKVEHVTRKLEIDLVARIRKHDKNGKFQKLGERLEDLRERHEQGLINSVEFLKMLIDLAKEARAAEREVVPEEEEDKGKAALTELFNGVKNRETPIIVQNVVNDIDEIVKVTRFEGWQATTAGVKEIKKQLRTILWMRYKLKDQDLFDKAYAYVEMYY